MTTIKDALTPFGAVPPGAIRVASAFVGREVAPRRCDAEASSECVRCTTVALSRWLMSALALLEDARPHGWQPIETAPTDGTRVIAWGPALAVAECEYRQAWHADSEGWYRSNQHPRVQPTHWMPLPDPPIAAGGPVRED